MLIGLTGGIASGKTLISDAFAALGIPVIDADLIARDVVAPGSTGLQKLVEAFGDSIIDNDKALNRAALRQIIFSNSEHRKTVDGILHPLIREQSDTAIRLALDEGHPYVIYAVPLLVETDQQTRFDRILVVDVPEELQIERLMQRDNNTREQAEAILAAQATRQQRLAVADEVIVNSASKSESIKHVHVLHEKYLRLAADELS